MVTRSEGRFRLMAVWNRKWVVVGHGFHVAADDRLMTRVIEWPSRHCIEVRANDEHVGAAAGFRRRISERRGGYRERSSSEKELKRMVMIFPTCFDAVSQYYGDAS